MEKIIQQIIADEKITFHDFYCDKCGAQFGLSIEHDDGTYHTLGNMCVSLYGPEGWYRAQACLCDKCRTKFVSEIEATLKRMGFSKLSHSKK